MNDHREATCLDVVSMLRTEYENIHGPLPPEDDRRDLDVRLRDFYAQVHAMPDPGRSALCLSGGGIRSASFCLGILQGLAQARVLGRFHYLSTVSGGGYIGSWLTAWIHRRFAESPRPAPAPDEPAAGAPQPDWRSALLGSVSQLVGTIPGSRPDEGIRSVATTGSELPLAPGAPAGDVLSGAAGLGGERPPEPQQIADLRRFTNYLSPRTGAFSLDTWTLAAVYLRNLLLNWLVVVPLLCAVLAVPHVGAALLGAATSAPKDGVILATVLLPAGGLLAVLGALLVWDLLDARSRDVGAVEARARWEGGLLGVAVCWVAFAGLVLYATDLLALVPRAWRIAVPAAGGLSGLATYLFKRAGDGAAKPRDGAASAGKNVRVATSAAALVTIVLIVATLAVGVSRLTDAVMRWLEPWPSHPRMLTPWLSAAGIVLLATVIVSAVFALLVDVNEFSLHALYRNRLVRGFLRASRGLKAARRDTAFDREDDLPLRNLWPEAGPQRQETSRHLFHVINATLNDVAGSRPEWNERKGVSFTFSPLHYGAHVAGRYGERTEPERGYRQLPRGREDWLTLGTAMTISGAAANPNMGYHSSPVVTFLMALFNVRLGWWLRAPWTESASGRPTRSPATAWRVWSREALGTTRFGSSLVNVSDGGHFDNLGLYEMIRRRCRYIVVVDAGEDGGDRFESLGEALRKIRVDFGVPITLTGLDLSDDAADGRTRRGPPVHAWHGTIEYSKVDGNHAVDASRPVPDGELVYFKPAVSGDETVDVQAYRRAHRAFPHESTVDQWFSESQFESYRKLGEHSVEHLLAYYTAGKGVQPAQAASELPARAGRPVLQPSQPEAASSGLSPQEFCHRVGESLSLMKRQRDGGSHAGGVVYRPLPDGDVEFLLVKSIDHTRRVLPKGHIEPWEDAVTTAAREVREEAALTLTPERSLGVFLFETPTRKVTTTYFLMRAPDGAVPGHPHEGHRDPRWFTIEEARRADLSVPPDVLEVLEQARTVVWRSPAGETMAVSHAGGVACRRRDGRRLEFLFVRSRDGTVHVLPKGHLEPGESAETAAAREVKEEAGIRLAPQRWVGNFPFPARGGTACAAYFTMDATEGGTGLREEEREPVWLTLEDARRAADPPVPRDVLEVLERATELLEDRGAS